MIKQTLVAILCVSLFACQSSAENEKQTSALAQIIDQYHLLNAQLDPVGNKSKGEHNKQLVDLSPEKLALTNKSRQSLLSNLLDIETSNLSTQEQINHAVLVYRLENEIDSYKFNAHFMPLTAESGFHVWISRFPQRMSFKTVTDYQNYLARLSALPQYFEQQTSWMEKGIQSGTTQPQVVLEGYEESIAAYIEEKPENSVYFSPFTKFPKDFTAEQIKSLTEQAKEHIQKYVNTSYQNFYTFMVERYIPQANKDIAATNLPNGQAFYENRVKHYTTLDITADEVHEIGLKEVSRIRAEMDQIIQDLSFEGSFSEFTHELRTNPRFYAKTGEELLKEASYIAKKMDAELPKFFKHLPRNPYGVAPVPATIAPKYTTGRYVPPSSDKDSGTYWVNTYRLDRRPLYVLEALTLHEAVPGHHLQGAITREMKNVPKFRNQTYISAFGEGWGLYAEYLGKEAGFYKDPYSDFGRLTYEMWRAARLVVDTGMHAKGWSRKKAQDFLADNTALSLHNVKTEIDRYISWPGQALSYKIGELKIKALRAKAEEQLGKDFDIRDFHDQILKNGSMPLSMLEKLIDEYIRLEVAKQD